MEPIKRQVLLVEDNEDLRELITRMLDSEDYDILAARDGEEALELIKSHRLDLVLLDIIMPGKSGIEVLREMRSSKDSQIKNLPVVMVTARSTVDDLEAVLSAGATSYIIKPFRSAALKAKIRDIFELPKYLSRAEKMVIDRRHGVLTRAITNLEESSKQDLHRVTHDIGGSIGFYTFEEEARLVLDFSNWLDSGNLIDPIELEGRRQSILAVLKSRLASLPQREINE